MRRYLILLVLVLFLGLGYAQNGLSGNITGAAQLSEDHKTLQELEKIAAAGTSNPDLFYNIGVCHHQLGRPGLATLYYLKALSLDSAHPQARHNLRLLRELDPIAATELSRPFLVQSLYDVIAWLNYSRLALLILISLALTALCAHWLIHLSPDAEKGPPVLLLSLCLLFLLTFTITLIFKQHRAARDDRAVVTIPLSTTYSDAGGQQASRNLPEGTIIRITGQDKSFWQARLEDGSHIWIKRGDVIRLLDL